MRLQRFLARSGAASRRGSENLMTAGRVTVNGEVVTELGSKVDPNVDVVRVDGVLCRLADDATYIMLNKPAGFVTTMRDPQGRPCVASLVPTDAHPGLFAVGRLDRDTTGLLLFTTDGDIAQALLHPSHHAAKHYVALVKGVLSDHEIERLEHGMVLDDGPCQPAEVTRIDGSEELALSVAWEGVPSGCSVVGMTLHEGRKHQVKRMLHHVNHTVLRLHRDSFGPLSLGDLVEGCWRELTEAEIVALKASTSEGGVDDGKRHTR
ncbi:MAG: rRNA pseudouridine synthase [Atopobiaceae bacterium]|jgi:23S rRNA pseudouridine2605 synthase|nr:rRNA pseudouridine synthase [Atopobiaceae bacterium]MCI2173195.1 rRNA pseudouridine synthase [Atopobiaceae bacterium]MCI2207190.1 rRNA pseudouridine synthase [Atopobiaceae bacterium]